LKRMKENIRKFLTGRYGIDELGKVLLWVSLILYMFGVLFQNAGLLFLSLVSVIIFLYRYMSRQIYERRKENSQLMRYVKLWKMKYEYRKTAKIYMCSQCGKMIRVPKGKRKIQITCRNCGHTIIRYT
jgi:DNA-directed RNA polymerase subunit RPC12/RpoP